MYDEIKVLQIIPAPDYLYAGFTTYYEDGDPCIFCNKVLCLALIEATSIIDGTKQLIDAVIAGEKEPFFLCQKSHYFIGVRTYNGHTEDDLFQTMESEYDSHNWKTNLISIAKEGATANGKILHHLRR